MGRATPVGLWVSYLGGRAVAGEGRNSSRGGGGREWVAGAAARRRAMARGPCGGGVGPWAETPLPPDLVCLASRAEKSQVIDLVATSLQRYELVALSCRLLDRFRAAEKMFLPVVGSVLYCQFSTRGDGFDRPNIHLVRVGVPANFNISPVRESVVNATAPAVRDRRVGVNYDREEA